nr:MAG: wsv432-like protein [Metapenaeopsis lamellata majanivirus]
MSSRQNIVQISNDFTNPPDIISDREAARFSKSAISIQSISSVPKLPCYIARLLLPRVINDVLKKSTDPVIFDPLSGTYKPNLFNLLNRQGLNNKPLSSVSTIRKILK